MQYDTQIFIDDNIATVSRRPCCLHHSGVHRSDWKPGILYDNYSDFDFLPDNPFGATVYGFQAGDQIDIYGNFLTSLNTYSLSWNQSTNMLTVLQSGGSIGQFTLAGSCQQSDFKLSVPGNLDVTDPIVITTTSVANAIPAFTYQDATTGAAGSGAATPYSGSLNYLQSEFLWPSQDSVNVAAHTPDVFIMGGNGNDALTALYGSNVLDGGLGSNFLTGGTGADGGTDTFIVDGSQGVSWNNTLVDFHARDSLTMWGFIPDESGITWTANDGSPGFAGATLHASFAGPGTPVNWSVTFDGISLATAQADFGITSGNVGGRDYLYVHNNG